MSSESAFDRFTPLAREVLLLESASDALAWDQEVMMPAGGAAPRAEQLAALSRIAHARETSPEFLDALAAAEAEAAGQPGDDFQVTELRLWRRRVDRETKKPTSLVTAIAEAQSLAQHEWAAARSSDDFARFAPWLERLVGLKRDEAACLAGDQEDPWDALADEFEPDVRAADLEPLFATLRPALVELLGELRERGTPVDDGWRTEPFPADAQEALVRAVSAAMGFDFHHGRLDRSTHPFCSGTHPGDVRMTTRFADADVADALGSTMHETGHGLYEQGLPAAATMTLTGKAVSLGIHESQSRLWENHVGRSRAFQDWLHPLAVRHLGERAGRFSPEAMWRAVNRVAPSLIRVEADEATYDLHVMVRFVVERELLSGALPVADLPARWNALYTDHLGIDVPNDREGCLQDVHWACGLFGYFPTYTLGNLYAAQFMEAARDDLGDLDHDFATGSFGRLRAWLRENIHSTGSRLTAAALCERVTGRPLETAPLLEHLRRRFRSVYGIG